MEEYLIILVILIFLTAWNAKIKLIVASNAKIAFFSLKVIELNALVQEKLI
jgi:hypothetical protein